MLPALSGRMRGARRSWAVNVLTSSDVEDLRRELSAKQYTSKTRGERRVGAARPVGEGKYQLLRHGNHTELAHVLELPAETGPAQQELGIPRQAGYIVAVKNPEVSIPGFTAPGTSPEYSSSLKAKFGHRRWIDADDPALLDQKNTQILLLGAHAAGVQEELGVEIEVEDETVHTAEVCQELRLSCEREAVRPLLTGELPAAERALPGDRVERLPPERTPGKGGEAGGKVAAAHGASAAAITRLLGGIQFPRSRSDLVRYAEEHRDRLANADEAIATLRKLPGRRYATMADVARRLGEVR